MIKELKKVFLSLLPTDGSTVGNTSLRRALEEALAAKGQEITEEDYWSAHAALMEEGFIATGKGRGGSVKLIKVAEDDFSLQAPVEKPADPAKPRASKAGSVTRVVSGGNDPAQIISYRHPDKRVNNPEVGMVNTATDPHEGKNQWAYDPHIDPALQFDPQRGAIEALIDDALHPAIEDALTGLNKTLRKSKAPAFTPSDGARKGKAIDLAKDELHEWEVPFDFPEVWPEQAKQAFEAFHQARMAMQKQMDDSIAAHADQETLYDQPAVSKNRLRITGPFTVEAVPFPSVKSLDEATGPEEADTSIARTGESGRQHQWRDELIKTGIRGKGGQMLKFADLETLPFDASIRNLHAVGHLQTGERVVISFGPEYAALEQRQVESAKNEAGDLFPTPKMIVFCAFVLRDGNGGLPGWHRA